MVYLAKMADGPDTCRLSGSDAEQRATRSAR
jgi:hypothetical protein